MLINWTENYDSILSADVSYYTFRMSDDVVRHISMKDVELYDMTHTGDTEGFARFNIQPHHSHPARYQISYCLYQ